MKLKKRYKEIKGKALIEVRVKQCQQLFDIRDPSPFIDRDLDDDFVEYIVSSAKEFSMSKPLIIRLHINEKEEGTIGSKEVTESYNNYFEYQTELFKKNLKNFIRKAQIFLLLGIIVLFTCIGLSQMINANEGFLAILKEGLVIFGWVSMWKPIELILFDWYPLYEKYKLYQKLLNSELELNFLS